MLVASAPQAPRQLLEAARYRNRPRNNIAHHVCSRHSLRGISNVRYMESLDIHLSGRLWPRLGRFIMSAFAPNPPVTLLSSSH